MKKSALPKILLAAGLMLCLQAGTYANPVPTVKTGDLSTGKQVGYFKDLGKVWYEQGVGTG